MAGTRRQRTSVTVRHCEAGENLTSRTSHPPRLTPRTGSLPYANVGLMALSPRTQCAKRVKREKTVVRRQVGVITRDRVEGVNVWRTRSTNFAGEEFVCAEANTGRQCAGHAKSSVEVSECCQARSGSGVDTLCTRTSVHILHVCWYAIELTRILGAQATGPGCPVCVVGRQCRSTVL